MNIILTGSLGNISKALALDLIKKSHNITVISSKEEKKSEIEKIGATAAIGSLNDGEFLAKAFGGADIVYLMEPPFDFFSKDLDMEAYYLNIADAFVHAINESGVKKVIHLSSIGGHANSGVGMLSIHHTVENILKALPDNVVIKTMRPVGFYYNMLAFIPAIKNAGAIIQNYGGDEKEPWVSPADIAEVIAEEMEKPFTQRMVRYIASDEVSPNEVAAILGNAIGKADLKWLAVPDEQFQANLVRIGFSEQAANGITEMNAGRRNALYADYQLHKPILSKTKLAEFAKTFAAAFTGQQNEKQP